MEIRALGTVLLSCVTVLIFAFRDYGLIDLLCKATSWNRGFVSINLGDVIDYQGLFIFVHISFIIYHLFQLYYIYKNRSLDSLYLSPILRKGGYN